MKQDTQVQANHPLALRVCIIAAVSYNVTLACMYGTFGILLKSVEAKLGVGRELSSLGVSLVMLGLALSAPIIGILAGKISVRLLMITGALMSSFAYVTLAVSSNIYIDLVVYAFLIGPAIALCASILPTTLVTRWYVVNRGRAIGIVTVPLAVVIMPLIAATVLKAYGLTATYGMLAAIMALLVLPLLFVIDYPPDAVSKGTADRSARAPADPGVPLPQLMRSGRFWTLSLGFAAITTSAIMRSAHFVPMIADWGIDLTHAATLAAIGGLTGMLGPVLFGWIGDRIGGASALAIVGIDSAILFALLLLKPSYFGLLPIIALIGIHGSAVVTTYGLALSQEFGQASFSRAFGTGYLIALPFNVLIVPIAARVYTGTGTYAGAIIGAVAFLVLASLLTLTARRATPAPAAPVAV